jgi:hypothetical protein
VVKALHRSIEAFGNINQQEFDAVAEDLIWQNLSDLKCEHAHPVELPIETSSELAATLSRAMAPVEMANERLETFLAFIKTFDQTEFSTIYCEREWRSIYEFAFVFDEIAMIVCRRLEKPIFSTASSKKLSQRLLCLAQSR